VRFSGQIIVLLAVGCANVDGGAVELSWKLRPASSDSDDKFVGCDDTYGDLHFAIAQMRLTWVSDDGTTGSRAWDCNDNHGVTKFEVPEGTALLSLAPECVDGPADPVTYVAPAPIERTVVTGDTVTLGALQLEVREAYCGDQPCICPVAP
jgi:hypothetical protein